MRVRVSIKAGAVAPSTILRKLAAAGPNDVLSRALRALGLSLLTVAIVHWNAIYLDQAVRHLRSQGVTIPDELLAHVAPLGWERIALNGDYDWSTARPAPVAS